MVLVMAFIISSLGWSAAASAECTLVPTVVYQDGVPHIELIKSCPGETTSGGPTTDEIRDSDLDALCVSQAIEMAVDPFAYCGLPPGTPIPVEVTPGMVAAALRLVPIPPSVLEVQPPNGRTLVNFDTNFYTESGPFDRTVHLLRQRVDLHIVPSEFDWRFGDGESLVTEEPGAPYPDLEVTHRYLKKGQVVARVDTTYAATYRVNGGPSIKVKGQVTIPGVPVDLQVLTATPALVGYDRDSFLGGGPE